MNVNKNYNRSKKEINYKYELLLKEILEHKDFSEILYEINGFADSKKWGVTERENIVCLDENNYRIKIEFIHEANSNIKIENKIVNTLINNENENTFENIITKNKDKKKKYRKKILKSKNKSSDCKDKKTNKRKTSTNFHRYFNNNNFYDSSHMKSYICSCGKKCICKCNSKYCKGDCECEFYDCYKKCHLYSYFCVCLYDSGEC
jgi:hypothetical protein